MVHTGARSFFFKGRNYWCKLLLSLGELLGCEGITLKDMEIARIAYLNKNEYLARGYNLGKGQDQIVFKP